MGFDAMLGCQANKVQEYFCLALNPSADQFHGIMGEHTGRSARDRLLAAMNDHRRRLLIAYMDESDTDVFSLDGLVEPLLEDDGDSGSVPEAEKRLKLGLHHRHLPLMDDAGLIEYDSRSGAIRYHGTPHSDLIKHIRPLDPDTEMAAAIDR